MLTHEERFWSKVWRCMHRQPCQRCCWPWHTLLRHPAFTLWMWKAHPVFSDAWLTGGKKMTVGRVAFLVFHRTLLLPHIVICHQCHFGPCCNPAHLRAGTQSDNSRDNGGKNLNTNWYPAITLPDGRIVHAS